MKGQACTLLGLLARGGVVSVMDEGSKQRSRTSEASSLALSTIDSSKLYTFRTASRGATKLGSASPSASTYSELNSPRRTLASCFTSSGSEKSVHSVGSFSSRIRIPVISLGDAPHKPWSSAHGHSRPPVHFRDIFLPGTTSIRTFQFTLLVSSFVPYGGASQKKKKQFDKATNNRINRRWPRRSLLASTTVFRSYWSAQKIGVLG